MNTIIVVDDEVSTTEFLKKYINNNLSDFIVVETFSNGEKVIEYLKNNKVDIILTDIRMPKKSGLEVAKYVYDNDIESKVIIMSAFNEFEYAREAIKYGVSQYLCKAIDVKELAEVLERVAKSIKKTEDNDDYSREKFFLDLVMGTCNRNTIKKRLEKLSINISTENISFEIFEISINNLDSVLDNWIYGKEKFISGIGQYLEKSIENLYIIYSDISNERLVFAAISEGNEKSIHEKRLKAEENNIIRFFHIFSRIHLIEYFSINEIFSDKSWRKNSSMLFGISDEFDENKKVNKEKIVAMAIKYIKENFNKDVTSKDVAETVFFNPIYFNKIFKSYIGMTVSDYILKIRMEHAIELLKGKNKITDIAKAVGYNSDRHFRRMFNLYTGYSVSEYRLKVLKQE